MTTIAGIHTNDKGEITYAEIPTQCIFWESEGAGFLGGIIYGDQIICGECGGTIDLADIYEDCAEGGPQEPIQCYRDWGSISDEIIGDEFPDGTSVWTGGDYE